MRKGMRRDREGSEEGREIEVRRGVKRGVRGE